WRLRASRGPWHRRRGGRARSPLGPGPRGFGPTRICDSAVGVRKMRARSPRFAAAGRGGRKRCTVPPASSPRPGPADGRRYPDAHRPPLDPPRPGTAADLTSESLLRPARRPPSEGWRRAVFTASRGLINPGESRGERRRRELRALVRDPVVGGHHRIAVLGARNGAGRTTTAVGLGSVLAEERGDRVIAV